MTKEKKQTLVVSVLVLAMAAIGAFQFMGPKPKAAPDDKKDKKPKDEQLVAENAEVDPTQAMIENLLSQPLSSRDPFTPQATLIEPPTQVVDPNQGQTQVAPPRTDPGSWTPPQTEITPIDPNFGNNGFGGPNSLQGPINQGAGTGPQVAAKPYALRAVMLGRINLCVLETANGRQVVVREGQQFGSDSEFMVVQIAEDHIVMRHRGADERLNLLGGN